MTSEYFWYLKDHIIYARLSGTVGEDDLRKGNAIVLRFLAETNSTCIHILFDCKDVDQITASVFQIRNEVHYLQHPSLGWVVIFGMDGVVERMVEFLTAVVIRLTGLQVQTVNTLDEGLVFLHRTDPSLSGLLPSVDVSA